MFMRNRGRKVNQQGEVIDYFSDLGKQGAPPLAGFRYHTIMFLSLIANGCCEEHAGSHC